ncbi:hypothetical protein GC169_09845 [bacterium]|nr:hypothetical protein [bacterium]
MAGPQPGGLDVRAALASGVVARMPGGSGLGPDELEARLALVKRLIADVNALAPGPDGGAGLPYPFLGFGPNSNSFFETARETMGLGSPEFPERAWLVPGAERLLLPPQEIARIRSEVQSGSPATIGARKEAIASATRSAPSAVG